jgi:transposase-like protein
MDCPKCKSSHHAKDGIIHGRQRYRCKECHFRYTVKRKSDVKTQETRRLALAIYLEGLGFRSIGRILQISYGTVYAWIKQWSAHISIPRRESPAETVDLEDLLAYIESKKTDDQCYGLLLIDLEKDISLLSVDSATRQGRLKHRQNRSKNKQKKLL